MASLSIADALADGIDRLADRRLLPVFAAATASQLLLVVSAQSQLAAQRELLEEEPTAFGEPIAPPELPLAIDAPLGVALLGWLAALVSVAAVAIVAIRVLVEIGADPVDRPTADGGTDGIARPDEGTDGGADGTDDAAATGDPAAPVDGDTPADDRSRDRPTHPTDDLVRATASALVAGFLASLAIGLGLVLVLPGLFLAASLAFTVHYVALRRAGPIDGMRRSWGLARGNRLRVLGVLVVAGVSYVALGVVGGFLTLLVAAVPIAGSIVVGELLNVAVNAAAWLLALSILTSAYDRLEAIRAAEAEKWAGVDDELLP